MSTIQIEVPDIGDFKDVEIIELLVKPGDTVKAEQSLITVESDKASMEIPSSASGTVVSLAVKVGDRVAQGSVILTLEASGSGNAAASTSASAPPPVSAPVQTAAVASSPVAAKPVESPVPPAATAPVASVAADSTAAAQLDQSKPHASPSVRKFARELGVDLTRVVGSGPKQRITQEDVQGFVKAALAGQGTSASAPSTSGGTGAGLNLLPWPKVDFAKFGPVTPQPLSRIKKISGANLHRNWVMIPHVTNHEEADITDLEALRVQLNAEYSKAGVKLTMLAFLIKACVAALKKFPEFNSSLDGDSLVLKQYYHVGFAADTPNGLMVPVIRNADQKGVLDIARETSELAGKAREGKLGAADMQGGTFSISSLGGIGGTAFTPIINAPEVAILGVSRAARKPVWEEATGQFVPRLIMPLSLSYDHRVIDGAAAARFNAFLAQLMADFRRVML
jgi:pyruvate dehydrogenase E2 component (dihydrolipoamide acetyltransferase)